jgi:hypothetical protein
MKNQFPAISRQNRLKALEEGKLTYESGTQCKTCGSFEKYVSNSSCVACIKIKTYNRDPNISKKYISSEKGQNWLKEFRKSDTYKNVQQKWSRKSGYRSHVQARRRKQIKETVKNLSKQELLEIKKIYEQAARLRQETGRMYHVDHIIRLADNGTHTVDNLQILDEDTHKVKTSSENTKRKEASE